jgi:hypothetical protein
MTPLQTLLAVSGIVITGEAMAEFLANHFATISAIGCFAIFTLVSVNLYRNRNNTHGNN